MLDSATESCLAQAPMSVSTSAHLMQISKTKPKTEREREILYNFLVFKGATPFKAEEEVCFDFVLFDLRCFRITVWRI